MTDQRVAVNACAADDPRIAAALARAFADDPAFAWIFPDPADRVRRLSRLFALTASSDARAGMVLATAGREAASLWRGPGRAAVGWGEMLRYAWPLARALGPAAWRALRVGNAIDAHLPAGDYWYLHMLGCDPDRQREGWGGAAVQGGIDRVGWRLPIYLETAAEVNLLLYHGLGFRITAEWRVPGGGPRFWSMRRAPA